MMSAGLKADKLIPANQVPTRKKATIYDEFFASIPLGQAAVLSEKNINSSSIRQALKRRQKEGLFINYNIVVAGKRGDRIIYVINEENK